MSIQIIINNTPIDFPSSAQSPNWAPALIEFAQQVEIALNTVVGPRDVNPTVIDILNNATTQSATSSSGSLNFPPTGGDAVRSAVIDYSVYRKTDNENHTEVGKLNVVYDSTGAGSWVIQRDFNKTNGSKNISFAITASGQVTFEVEPLIGLNYEGKLSFSAKALLQTS